MDIAIYGIGKVAKRFCESLKDLHKDISIVYFVQSKKDVDAFEGRPVVSVNEMSWNDFDKLVIASSRFYDEILNTLQYDTLSRQQRNVVLKPHDFLSEYQFKSPNEKVSHYFTVTTCEGLEYLGEKNDLGVMKNMVDTGYTHSCEMIKLFFNLVSQYYKDKNKSKNGYFLDIGANIGTTSIYVKKNIDSNLRVIGFEAGKQNYDIYRINCILNGVEDIRCEGIGLSNATKKMKYRYVSENPGGGGINGEASEVCREDEVVIQVTSLDEWLDKNRIDASNIDYIWMDIENSEPDALEGAYKALKKKKIPLLQEFSVVNYYETHRLDKYLKIVGDVYDGFIDVHDTNLTAHPISELPDFSMNMVNAGKVATDLFFF